MSEDITIFRGATGLNTVVDQVRVPFDPQTGITDLAVAINVTVDRTGRVSRRDGYSKVLNMDCHSLFCDGGPCLFVTGDELCILGADYSRTVIRTGMAETRVDYAQVNDAVYYTNGSQLGFVQEEEDHAWLGSPVVGEVANRGFQNPIPGQHIAFHAGRIFLSVDNTIIFSEPFAFAWFDMARNVIPMESKVLMMKPVAQGLFVSTERATYFIQGLETKDFMLIQVANYPAIEWSVAIDYVDAEEIGLPNPEPGQCALWASPKGACLGTASGRFYNLNRNKVVYPETGPQGAGLLRGYDFIHSIL